MGIAAGDLIVGRFWTMIFDSVQERYCPQIRKSRKISYGIDHHRPNSDPGKDYRRQDAQASGRAQVRELVRLLYGPVLPIFCFADRGTYDRSGL